MSAWFFGRENKKTARYRDDACSCGPPPKKKMLPSGTGTISTGFLRLYLTNMYGLSSRLVDLFPIEISLLTEIFDRCFRRWHRAEGQDP